MNVATNAGVIGTEWPEPEAPSHEARCLWLLCAPAPEGVQGRGDLFWFEEGWEWVESSDEATPFTDAEKAALDLSRFEDPDSLGWWTRQLLASPHTLGDQP